MTPAARIASAIEILADVEARRRPVADVLEEWGQAHRFAGSKDRAALSALVYDALRCRASARWIMGADSARATMIGALNRARWAGVASRAGAVFRRGSRPRAAR